MVVSGSDKLIIIIVVVVVVLVVVNIMIAIFVCYCCLLLLLVIFSSVTESCTLFYSQRHIQGTSRTAEGTAAVWTAWDRKNINRYVKLNLC